MFVLNTGATPQEPELRKRSCSQGMSVRVFSNSCHFLAASTSAPCWGLSIFVAERRCPRKPATRRRFRHVDEI